MSISLNLGIKAASEKSMSFDLNDASGWAPVPHSLNELALEKTR